MGSTNLTVSRRRKRPSDGLLYWMDGIYLYSPHRQTNALFAWEVYGGSQPRERPQGSVWSKALIPAYLKLVLYQPTCFRMHQAAWVPCAAGRRLLLQSCGLFRKSNVFAPIGVLPASKPARPVVEDLSHSAWNGWEGAKWNPAIVWQNSVTAYVFQGLCVKMRGPLEWHCLCAYKDGQRVES